MSDSQESPTPTAAVILIGNELLSGRTRDINLSFMASNLSERGLRTVEARVISDDAATIVGTVNELRKRYDFVFTTGGIGPTHDDITAENVAAAFGVELHLHPEAESRLLAYFKSRDVEPNSARMRMARVPVGATLVDNPVSIAPGFRMGNVYVMAGVPKIMQAMFQNILPELPDAGRMHSVSVVCDLPEGILADPLEVLQRKNTDVDIGSYPGKNTEFRNVTLVVRGINTDKVEDAAEQVRNMVVVMGGQIIQPA